MKTVWDLLEEWDMECRKNGCDPMATITEAIARGRQFESELKKSREREEYLEKALDGMKLWEGHIATLRSECDEYKRALERIEQGLENGQSLSGTDCMTIAEGALVRGKLK